jgi:hypothetical protein
MTMLKTQWNLEIPTCKAIESGAGKVRALAGAGFPPPRGHAGNAFGLMMQ